MIKWVKDVLHCCIYQNNVGADGKRLSYRQRRTVDFILRFIENLSFILIILLLAATILLIIILLTSGHFILGSLFAILSITTWITLIN